MIHTSQVWEENADWWRDTFTNGADEEYEEQILPIITDHLRAIGAKRVLDIGTGEGQVARVAAQVDSTDFVVGIDFAIAQLRNAQQQQQDASVVYVQSNVSCMPFKDGSFDAVTMCLVLEHVNDINAAFKEIARVLQSGGYLLLFLNHPAFQMPDSGWVDDQIVHEQYWRSGPYLPEATTLEQVDGDVTVPFTHRPLSVYFNAMAAEGLALVHMEEPVPFEMAEYPGASTIPRLLFCKMLKL